MVWRYFTPLDPPREPLDSARELLAGRPQEGERRALVLDDRAHERLRLAVAVHAVGLLRELAEERIHVHLGEEAVELLGVGLLAGDEHVVEELLRRLRELGARRAAELLEPRLEEPRVGSLAELRHAEPAAQALVPADGDPAAERRLAEGLPGAVAVEEGEDLPRGHRAPAVTPQRLELLAQAGDLRGQRRDRLLDPLERFPTHGASFSCAGLTWWTPPAYAFERRPRKRRPDEASLASGSLRAPAALAGLPNAGARGGGLRGRGRR